MKWSAAKIRQKRAYFRAQREAPTGNFTEFVVRTYYCIYRCCQESGGNSCPAELVSGYRIKGEIYKGIYAEPDHGYRGVIEDCKRHLIEMGYIHLEDDGRVIVLDKPLDFLLPGEHEAYLARFAPAAERAKTKKLSVETSLRCPSCGKPFVLRAGKFGMFLGCGGFPGCRETRSIAEATYELLRREGIALYGVTRPCWKCGASIRVLSYFPIFDLLEREPEMMRHLERLSVLRLSTLPTLDAYLQGKYAAIQERYSKKAGFAYIGNLCPHCGALQGSQMTLGKVYDDLKDSREQGALPESVVERIPVSEETVPWQEWKEAVEYLLRDDTEEEYLF